MGKGGGRRKVRERDRRGEREGEKKDRERRADGWAPLSCGVHASKTTIRSVQWLNIYVLKVG